MKVSIVTPSYQSSRRLMSDRYSPWLIVLAWAGYALLQKIRKEFADVL
jgi:hypothetical protein